MATEPVKVEVTVPVTLTFWRSPDDGSGTRQFKAWWAITS